MFGAFYNHITWEISIDDWFSLDMIIIITAPCIEYAEVVNPKEEIGAREAGLKCLVFLRYILGCVKYR